jgi:hypothetical protein
MAKARYEVIGEFPIQGCDGSDVRHGGVVELCQDADCATHSPLTNVFAIVQAGLIRPVEDKPKTRPSSSSSGGGDG